MSMANNHSSSLVSVAHLYVLKILRQVYGRNAQKSFFFVCVYGYANMCTSVASCVSLIVVFMEGWCNVSNCVTPFF